jgi:LysM repeat protein
MDPRTRQQVTHYGAPAAFLAAVTIAVILIKAGLNGGSGSTTTAALPTTSTATKTTTTTKLVLTAPQAGTTSTATATDTTAPGAEYYVVQSGDTLGSMAEKYSTTVDELMTLNPGIDPTALHIGQKIRVK